MPLSEDGTDVESSQHVQEVLASLKRAQEIGMEAFAGQAKITDAFETGEPILCCMDEGCAGHGTLRSAGSGILTEGVNRATFIQAMKDVGIAAVTSHEGCGAAGLFAKNHGIEGKTTDEVAIEEAQKIAAELGVPYKGHITAAEMRRPKEYHDAVVVYYDGTGKLNSEKLLGKMPQGFVISRRHMTREQATGEVVIALTIAFGAHGMSGQLSAEVPFTLVPIGDPENPKFSMEALTEELRGVQATSEYADRIHVDGFTAPKPGLAFDGTSPDPASGATV